MRRVLIGFGTPLGYYLASRGTFTEFFTYKQALNGISRCDEAVMIVPAGKRLGGSTLGPQARALIAALAPARRIVLLSSVDAYSSKGLPFDETAKPCASPGKSWLPLFEREFLAQLVPSQVLRLPDLFGPYNEKGMDGCFTDGEASKINRVAIHQCYPVRRLESDIAAAREIEAPIVNLVPEPLQMKVVLAELFPGQVGQVLTPAPYSRIRTLYAGRFGGSGGYIMSAGEVLAEIVRHARDVRDLRSGTKRVSAFAAPRAFAGAQA